MGDDHGPPGRGDDSDLDILRTPAELHQDRVLLVRAAEDLVAGVEDREAGGVRVRNMDVLELADHDRSGSRRVKPALRARHLRGVARRGDDARLLDRHGDEVVALVDPEVHRDSEGNRHRPHDVLDHPVDLVKLQSARVPDRADFLFGEIPELSNDAPSVLGFLLVEAGNLG